MEIVRVTDAHELSAEDQRFCEATKAWLKFYTLDRPPAVFRWIARDVGFLQSYWAATRQAFTDRALDRLLKEILAFAASMTGKSDYGVDFHLREARRLGLSERALTETVEVVQLFNTVTKIADALRLQPDFDPPSRRPSPPA